MLFPAIQPGQTWRFPVSDLHTLYLEECGNPDGVPIVFLHGGPGGSCEPGHRRFFDPESYRIILFDQRGAGKSRPHASLENNTTPELIADLEKIRAFLNIERWVVFGGSWGSTLSLVYAETHPERVLGMVLRGIFLCRRHEIDWFYQQGTSRLFPDYWRDYLAPIPETEHDDLLNAYYRRLTGENDMERMAAARAWSLWEGRTATMAPSESVVEHFGNPFTALSLARIECHYFVNDSFLEPNQILRDAKKLAGIPGVIVHGRYDVICPLENAWQLHQAWPDSELRVIASAGHSASEPATVDALILATNEFAERLS